MLAKETRWLEFDNIQKRVWIDETLRVMPNYDGNFRD